MKMRIVLATIASLAFAGCLVGDVDPVAPEDTTPVVPNPNQPLPEGDAAAAKAAFDTSVAPIMQQKCGGCHTAQGGFTPLFLGAGPVDGYYTALVADTLVNGGFRAESARLLLKLQIGPHQGVTYSQDEVTTISNWLTAELAVRNPGQKPGDIPPAAPVDALAQWSGCMTLSDWQQTNMGQWANKQTNDGDTCAACHGNGLARFATNPQSTTMFEANRFELFINGFFAVELDPVSGEGKIIPAVAKLKYMGSNTPGNNHPRYNINDNDQNFQRLQQFYQLTSARVESGECGAAQFPVGNPPL